MGKSGRKNKIWNGLLRKEANEKENETTSNQKKELQELHERLNSKKKHATGNTKLLKKVLSKKKLNFSLKKPLIN